MANAANTASGASMAIAASAARSSTSSIDAALQRGARRLDDPVPRERVLTRYTSVRAVM
jgi:hypothetical protein